MGIIDEQDQKNPLPKQPEKAVPLKKVLKTLHIGWKHKQSKDEVYKQMRDPIGGIKKLDLDRNISYSLDQIKILCVAAMENSYNKEIVTDSVIHLGNYQGEIFSNFTNPTEKKIDFWEFSDRLKCKNSQLRLYLLTTPLSGKDNVKTHSSSDTLSNSGKQSSSSNDNNVKITPSSSETPNNSGQKSSQKLVYSGSIISLSKRKNRASRSNNSLANSKTSMSSHTDDIENQLRFLIPMVQEEDIKFIDTVLGHGAFGAVILATWNNTEVAVKKIKSSEQSKYVYREVNVMDKIRHPNLISIMGICCTNSFYYIIMEDFKSVNLSIFISKRNKSLDYEI
ncbi:probable serine/threonine-protein kinase samkB [Cotesia glomerata]|uniref:probable serine/threonine-protein kinase samkB n=1 Tax=Cotesia glomerata TaxID=32391 RepID=UPI001D01D7C1|nr:probable serine/threonine-protein kinase samkB [Cotesia glomerata]